MTIDVLIPVYGPDEKFRRLMQMLARQTKKPDRVIIMNTQSELWRPELAVGVEISLHHLTREEFDHGGTRNRAAKESQADLILFMTDDAVPADRFLLERLEEAFSWTGPGGEEIAAAYARQLPTADCGLIERCARAFNYPGQSRVKVQADLPQLGIKTYFASNVCCAYRRKVFQELGGFVTPTIFNEDMIFAADMLRAGYGVAYAADAKVIHSHNFNWRQQFRRNFDLAVSQTDHSDIFAAVPSEGEGIRLVKHTACVLLRERKPWLLLSLLIGSGCKYLGYRLGKCYRNLPKSCVYFCTSNRAYWRRKERRHL